MKIDKGKATKLAELQLNWLNTPIIVVGNVDINNLALDVYRGYFEKIVEEYKIEVSKIKGIMPDGEVIMKEESSTERSSVVRRKNEN